MSKKKCKKLSYSKPVLCTHCNQPSQLVKGKAIYPHREDLYYKHFYLCKSCNAYVGCHQDTNTPYGTPANENLRKLRNQAHKVFDKLWTSKLLTRFEAYKALANYMELHVNDTHIGMFNERQCEEAIVFSERHFKELIRNNIG